MGGYGYRVSSAIILFLGRRNKVTSIVDAGWFFAGTDIAPELRLLVDHLAVPWRGQPPPTAAPLAPRRLVALARHHRVATPLLAALGEQFPELTDALRPLAQRQQRRATALALETVRLSQALRAAGIPFLVIKGAPLSVQLFGSPTARASRDVDILLPPEKMPALAAELGRLGYQEVPDPDGHNAVKYLHAATQHLLEAHTALAEVDALLPMDVFRPYDAPAQLAVFGEAVPTLSLEKAVVYAAYHGTRHLWSELAWVVDMAAACQADLDWDRVFALADQLRIRPQLALGCQLAHDLLGAPRPSQADDIPAARLDALAHLRKCPPVSQRDAVAALGILAFLRWEMRQYSSLGGKIAILVKHSRVSSADRAMVTLPAALAFLYVPLRLMRIALGWLSWSK